ncbi:MAG: alanyl-tRNA editing protein AlaX [Candidatus Woesearchaeota archaeon]|nr:MAG: alanyl-tRNA editing protein AlaX [Candidatus Woesearchaeota archaeon]
MKAAYLKDCYKKEFISKIVFVSEDGLWVELEETYFYPTSGGQPNDEGFLIKVEDSKNNSFDKNIDLEEIKNIRYSNLREIEQFAVKDVLKKDGKILHNIVMPGLKIGDKVIGRINWERRYKLMRYHTASHVLSTVINIETGAEITGNQLYTDKARVDFSLENFDRELMNSFESKTNDIMKKNLPVSFRILEREDAFKIPGLVKLRKQIPETIREIRIVDIGEFDHQACGGTHLKNTSEIGSIKITELENKGKDRRRIYFKIIDNN